MKALKIQKITGGFILLADTVHGRELARLAAQERENNPFGLVVPVRPRAAAAAKEIKRQLRGQALKAKKAIQAAAVDYSNKHQLLINL